MTPKFPKSIQPLDYQSAPPVDEDRLRITPGAISLLLSLLAAAITMAVFFADYRGKMFPLGINGTYRMTMVLSGIGLIIGLFGLFSRHGRSLAVLGVVICLLNLGFIPSFMGR